MLLRAAFSADSISMGDIIDSKIRRTNNWSLLESQAFYSSVLPGHYMSGNFVGQINFPGWLGKNSKKNKFKRLISELQAHTRTRYRFTTILNFYLHLFANFSASASKMAVKLDYLVPLRNAILSPLKKQGLEGIDQAVAVMKNYNLLREDVDSLLELCQWTGGENPMNSVETKASFSNRSVRCYYFIVVIGEKCFHSSLQQTGYFITIRPCVCGIKEKSCRFRKRRIR